MRSPNAPAAALLVSCLAMLSAASVARAQAQHNAGEGKGAGKDNPWSHVTAPSKGTASAIGEYSSGCLRGASQLALDGPGYQVMHPSRLRYFGHPELVAFIEQLGRSLQAAKQGDVMVGDLSQPRGGPAPGGHSSHQTGLDVDLWYWQPSAAARGPLPRDARESTAARSVLDPKAATIKAELNERVIAMLHLTADDPRVERMFVHPIIKREACAVAGDRTWLRKVRPWYGHDDHFHVRLYCPEGAKDCSVQTPVPAGDGCKELDWWFSPSAQEDRKKGQVTYQSKVGKAPGMPSQCLQLLDKPVAKTAPPDAAEAPLQAAAVPRD